MQVRVNPDGSFRTPRLIPQGRSNYFEYCIVALCAVLFGVVSCYYDMQYVMFCVSTMILSMVVVEIIQRLVMLVEEYFSLQSRYDNSYKKLFLCVFSSTIPTVLFVTGALIITSFTWNKQTKEAWFFNLLTMIIYVTTEYLQLKTAPIYNSIQISNPKTMDVGAGMAIGFFHGYLRILLPNNPQNDRGLKHVMEIYEAKERIKFARRALYILVPLSLHCPFRLTDMSDIMEESSSLAAIEEDRAGVKNRNYKNSVYKIKCQRPDGKEGRIYVAAEYASPLKTFKESVESDGKFALHYQQHKTDILWKFYTTIVQLVKEDPLTDGLCEFIYYADFDKRGARVDIGKVLLKRLHADIAADKKKQEEQ
ncbi:stimulator of interferon genes protein homolog [Atheta coriaria]|uniref:stimulator of interferon genes protein homolog n=1 Tax=Dalotia coriaria TaxID=877792 RepID=UPI0031F431D1